MKLKLVWPCIARKRKHTEALTVTSGKFGSMFHNQSLKKWIYYMDNLLMSYYF